MENSAPSNQGKIIHRYLIKALIFGVLTFAGVAGGVYVGTALSDRQASLDVTSQLMRNTSYLKSGDLFPDYELIEYKSGTKTSVSALSKDGPTLLLFLSTSCDVCFDLAQYVNEKLVKNLDDDIEIALIFDETELAELQQFPDSLFIPDSKIFTTDRSSQRLEDGINIDPSVFGIDKNRKIKFGITGFNRMMSAELINESI